MDNVNDAVNKGIMPKTLSGETLFGIGVTLISAGCFQMFSRIVSKWLTPKAAQHSAWRWKNIFVSFVHSIITGVSAVFW